MISATRSSLNPRCVLESPISLKPGRNELTADCAGADIVVRLPGGADIDVPALARVRQAIQRVKGGQYRRCDLRRQLAPGNVDPGQPAEQLIHFGVADPQHDHAEVFGPAEFVLRDADLALDPAAHDRVGGRDDDRGAAALDARGQPGREVAARQLLGVVPDVHRRDFGEPAVEFVDEFPVDMGVAQEGVEVAAVHGRWHAGSVAVERSSRCCGR